MAKSKHTVKKAPKGKRAAPKGPIWYSPSRGLMVSMIAQTPKSAEEKIVTAKSIVQAVVAAHNAGSMEGENYDIHWPLQEAIYLLERASEQLGVSHG
jgi:hypothetical protein